MARVLCGTLGRKRPMWPCHAPSQHAVGPRRPWPARFSRPRPRSRRAELALACDSPVAGTAQVRHFDRARRTPLRDRNKRSWVSLAYRAEHFKPRGGISIVAQSFVRPLFPALPISSEFRLVGRAAQEVLSLKHPLLGNALQIWDVSV